MNVQPTAYQTDIGIRRLAGATVEDRGDHLVIETPANRGFWWGNFILLAAPPGAGETERLRSMFERAFPTAAHLALGVDGTDGETGDAAVIGELGLGVEINAVLSAVVLREPRPAGAGAVLRRLRGDDDWAQAAEVRLEVYEEPDNDEQRAFVERQLAESRELCERGDGAWFGAFADGRLVSALGLIRALPDIGRYQTVETLEAYRRRGMAGRLRTRRAGGALARSGCADLSSARIPSTTRSGCTRRLGSVSSSARSSSSARRRPSDAPGTLHVCSLHASTGPAAGAMAFRRAFERRDAMVTEQARSALAGPGGA